MVIPMLACPHRPAVGLRQPFPGRSAGRNVTVSKPLLPSPPIPFATTQGDPPGSVSSWAPFSSVPMSQPHRPPTVRPTGLQTPRPHLRPPPGSPAPPEGPGPEWPPQAHQPELACPAWDHHLRGLKGRNVPAGSRPEPRPLTVLAHPLGALVGQSRCPGLFLGINPRAPTPETDILMTTPSVSIGCL